jgi:hypothetical protein
MLVYRIVDHLGAGMYRAQSRPSLWELAVGGDTAGNFNHPCPAQDGLLVRNWPEFAKRHGYKVDAKLSDEHYATQWEMYDQLKTHAFGFDSVKQLLRWVYGVGWLEAMHELGGVVQIFEVPDEHVLIGRCQCTFDTRHAERMPDVSMIDLEA